MLCIYLGTSYVKGVLNWHKNKKETADSRNHIRRSEKTFTRRTLTCLRRRVSSTGYGPLQYGKTHWQVSNAEPTINVTRRSKHLDADWPMMLPIGSFARKQGDFARENRIRLEIVYRRDFSKQLLPTSTLLLLLRESIFASHTRGCTHRDAKCFASLLFRFYRNNTHSCYFDQKEKKKNWLRQNTMEERKTGKRWSILVFEKDVGKILRAATRKSIKK